jgi:hypothetical protein
MYSLLDPDTLKYVHERHPGLFEAAYQLAAAVHEEKPTPSTSKAGTQTAEDMDVPPPFAYNLDEMSDEEEEMEDMDTGEVQRDPRGGRRSLIAPITADQLASAIAAAQTSIGGVTTTSASGMGGMTGFTSHRPPTSSAGGTRNLTMPSASSFLNAQAGASNPRSSSGGASGITQDQLAAALAIACGSYPSSGIVSGHTATPTSQPNYDSQLATMRELGITDTQLATRALNVMAGDVQAAIDLIYSGWSGQDDSAA